MNYRRIPFLQGGRLVGNGLDGLEGRAMKVIRAKVDTNAAPGWRGFVKWLARTHPQVYNMTKASAPNEVAMIENAGWPGRTLSGDETPPQSMIDKLVTSITAAGAAILPLVQQQKLLKIQLARAKAGDKPLDIGAYSDPNQGVNVGLNPSTQKTLLWLGGGLVLALVLPRVLR